MPTYLYECQTCEKTFEADQRITEDPLKDCHCGAQGSLKRLIQPTAVLFKGSGFYVNDSSSPAPAEPAACDSPSSDGSCACKASDDA